MFHFIDFSKDKSSENQSKGELFEKLIAIIIGKLGFKNIDIRVKRSSLEYDIFATSKIGNKKLRGEAKARIDKISGDTIATFVGKMHPEWGKDSQTVGMFISISGLTPDAKDYISTIQERDNLTTIIGDQIIEYLVKDMGYQSINQIQNKSIELYSQFNPGKVDLLISERGNYFLQFLVTKGETLPTAFCIFRHNGEPVNEIDFANVIKQRIKDFKELNFISSSKPSIEVKTKESIFGLNKGTGWFDYKLPAPPDCFVGRDDKIRLFFEFIERKIKQKTGISIFQVLSRSGVGKSSFLLKLEEEIKKQGGISLSVDARNLRSSLDILNTAQFFVKSFNEKFNDNLSFPNDLNTIWERFQEVDKKLLEKKSTGIIFIDQFESLFYVPEIFTYMVDFITDVAQSCKNIIFCITRKNDQPTTFDEKSDIDITRLSQLSENINLEDFSKEEALTLIEKVEIEISRSLKRDIKEEVLRFSGGFPWRHKWICAHIIRLIKNEEYTQEEIINAGLKADVLIEEEMATLDEMEKDLMKRMAFHLPATFSDLLELFGKGEVLSEKLRKFKNLNLIRLTGKTFDTYNDVFKEYLKSGKLPAPDVNYLYRTSPKPTVNLLLDILKNRWLTLREIIQKKHESKGTIFNKCRELRLLGLIDYSKQNIKVMDITRVAKEQDKIPFLIQEKVKQNSLVKSVLQELSISKEFDMNRLIEIIKDSFPLTDASKETWRNYALILSRWLNFTKLAACKNEILYLRSEFDAKERLTFPTPVSIRGFLPENCFLPSVYIDQVKGLVLLTEKERSVDAEAIKKGSGRKTIYPILNDTYSVGLIDQSIDSKMFVLSELGKKFANIKSHESYDILREFMLNKINISKFIEELKHYQHANHTELLRNVMANYGTFDWTDSTWNWRGKVLSNWLEYARIIERSAGNIWIKRQEELF